MRTLSISLCCGLAAVYSAAAVPVVVGKYPAKIVPEQISDIRLPENGIITDLAPAGNLEKDSIIAIINKEQTKQDREELDLSIRRERISKKDARRELEKERSEVEHFLNTPEDQRKYNPIYKRKEDVPAWKDINERIELLDDELATLERRKNNEFKRKHDPLTIKMPFKGKLQYNVPLPQTEEELANGFKLPENNMRSFATVCDDSAYYIAVSINEGEHSLLNENNFSVSIPLPEGKKLSGNFAHRKVEQSGNGDALIYYFRVQPDMHETAYRMLGSRYTATLSYDADGEVLRVSKAQLATHPEAHRCEDWEQLVQIAYPDYRVVIIGTRDVVLSKKPQQSDSQENGVNMP